MVDDITKALLRKLVNKGFIGGKHTAYDNLPKGFSQHLHKEVLKAADELVKANILVKKPTSYGLHVYLNPNRLSDVKKMLEGDESG